MSTKAKDLQTTETGFACVWTWMHPMGKDWSVIPGAQPLAN